jgi:hypothetical protein
LQRPITPAVHPRIIAWHDESGDRMIKLYITPGSPYARMARIVALEKGLAERVETVAAKTRTADSPYYGINPSGRVPYLVREDGVGMEESALICAYLDHLDGRPAFELPGGHRIVGGTPTRVPGAEHAGRPRGLEPRDRAARK